MTAQERLEAIYRDHAPALFRFLLRFTGDEAQTKDVLQDVFIRLARGPELLDGVRVPKSFLFRLAHRLAIDRQRREHTRQRYDHLAQQEGEAHATPDFTVHESDAAWTRQILAGCLDSLPPEQKAVVALKIWEELTFAEVAEILGISAHTAASRYRYALDKLRDALRPIQGDLR